MAYDYHNAIVADVEKMIRENKESILEHFEAGNLEEIDREALESEEVEDYYAEYGVENGNYFFDSYKSAEALIGNNIIIADAFSYFDDYTKLGSNEKEISAQFLDSTVRQYEVFNCIREAIDNVIKSPDKQVRESEPLDVSDYNTNSYRERVSEAIKEYVTDNIDDILEENNINSVEDYKNGKENVEGFIFQKTSTEEITIPLPSDRDVMHNLEEVLGNANLADFDYTIQNYFTDENVEYHVKEHYADKVAIEQILSSLDETYDKVILPALEQREAEQDIDRD